MTSEAKPMLFLPPRPPFALPPRGTVSLGRSHSCDLHLSSPDASRRHAEISAGPDGYSLRDLASTNGTFVNGERIETRALRPGDRIEIGGELLTFCLVGPGMGAPPSGEAGEAETVLAERPAYGESIRGDLAEIPPFAVLQILELGRKSGLVVFEGGEGGGRLWLGDGAPIHAETKSLRGFDAAVELVNASSGRFAFEPNRAAPERTIQASVTELLLEASRRLDEGS
jgi:hypothetical protein